MMPEGSLFDTDRRARALERAALSYSLTGGSRVPIILDRTIGSLAGVRRWLSEVPSANRDWVHDYLVMTALTVRGRNVDKRRVPINIDEFERWLSTELRDGTPWSRPRTGAIHFHILAGQGLISQTRELVHRLVPSLQYGEEGIEEGADETPWSWATIVDTDELRADVDDDGLVLTVTVYDGDRNTLEADLTRLYRGLAETWGTGVFAVGYDIDEVDSVKYLLRGFAGGLPRWVFGGAELGRVPGANAIPGTDPPAYRITPTPANIANLCLANDWPHVE
jgi:hypothetical protein